jgi:uncharacterized membrane-anchored protein YitT (DUF2179 family)
MRRLLRGGLNLFFVALGVLSAGLGLEGFLLPNNFIDGGVTGVSMLVAALTGWKLPALIAAINAPFVLMGYFQVTRRFAAKSAAAILALAACLLLVRYPVVTHDKLLAAVFGGVFLGAGIGLAIRGGGVLDGTEILALLLSKRVGATVGELIFILNAVIFSTAAFLLGVETAMYSTLTYFAASRTIDFLIHGLEQYTGVMIVSARSEQIRAALITELGRGVTVFQGRGGFTEADQEILFCAVTRLEIPRINAIVAELDAAAFTVMSPLTDVHGGVIRRRALH